MSILSFKNTVEPLTYASLHVPEGFLRLVSSVAPAEFRAASMAAIPFIH